MSTSRNSLLLDEAQEAAQRTTKTYGLDRLGISDNEVALKANMSKVNVKRSGRNQHAPLRFARKMNL